MVSEGPKPWIPISNLNKKNSPLLCTEFGLGAMNWELVACLLLGNSQYYKHSFLSINIKKSQTRN
jgi:hypothetical protein